MKRIVFILGIMLNSTFALADEMPFYFFYFEPNGIPNPMSKEEAQKKLCKLVTKNCELSGDEKFTFTILPLYEKADLKSQETGYFVNVTLPKRKDYGAFYESALASFVINRKGDRKDLTHYVSYSSEWIKSNGGGVVGRISFDEGDQHKLFYAYMRADKALPNTPDSYMKKSKDGKELRIRPKSEFVERWYGLANPDESGGVLWLRYKSDLRNPRFAHLSLNPSLAKSTIDELMSVFGPAESNRYVAKSDGKKVKSLFICRMLNDKEITLVHAISYDYLSDLKKKRKKLIMRDDRALPKSENREICLSEKATLSKFEYAIRLDKIYKNGFFRPGFGIPMIELKEYVEYQEVWPVLMTFEEISNKSSTSSKSKETTGKVFEPSILLQRPSLLQE